MGGFISNLRVSRHHSLDFCRSAVIVKAEAALTNRVQAGIAIAGSAEEDDDAETCQDYYFTVVAGEEKKREGGETDEDEG